jgi:hypothetical protein
MARQNNDKSDNRLSILFGGILLIGLALFIVFLSINNDEAQSSLPQEPQVIETFELSQLALPEGYTSDATLSEDSHSHYLLFTEINNQLLTPQFDVSGKLRLHIYTPILTAAPVFIEDTLPVFTIEGLNDQGNTIQTKHIDQMSIEGYEEVSFTEINIVGIRLILTNYARSDETGVIPLSVGLTKIVFIEYYSYK